MGGETLFRRTVRDASANLRLGCLGACAGIATVVVVMNLILLATGQSMSDSLESFVHVSIPVGLVVAMAFGAATWRFAKSSARELELRRVDGALVLTISPNVELEGRSR